jgi:hypothetical protein
MGGHASILFLRGKQALSAKKTAHTPDLDVNPTTAIAVVLILPEVREFNTKPILTNTTRGGRRACHPKTTALHCPTVLPDR